MGFSAASPSSRACLGASRPAALLRGRAARRQRVAGGALSWNAGQSWTGERDGGRVVEEDQAVSDGQSGPSAVEDLWQFDPLGLGERSRFPSWQEHGKSETRLSHSPPFSREPRPDGVFSLSLSRSQTSSFGSWNRGRRPRGLRARVPLARRATTTTFRCFDKKIEFISK